MSFICVATTTKDMVVFTDGMLIRETSDRTIKVYEDYKQFEPISSNQFIAFSGPYEVCRELLKKYRITKYRYTRKSKKLKKVAYELWEELSYYKGSGYNLQFIVGGLDHNQLLIYMCTNGIEKPICIVPQNKEEFLFVSLVSDKLADGIKSNLESNFLAYLYENDGEVVIALQKLLCYVMKHDPTVNDNGFGWIVQAK